MGSNSSFGRFPRIDNALWTEQLMGVVRNGKNKEKGFWKCFFSPTNIYIPPYFRLQRLLYICCTRAQLRGHPSGLNWKSVLSCLFSVRWNGLGHTFQKYIDDAHVFCIKNCWSQNWRKKPPCSPPENSNISFFSWVTTSLHLKIQRNIVQGVFLTGTPLKSFKYKQVNLGYLYLYFNFNFLAGYQLKKTPCNI